MVKNHDLFNRSWTRKDTRRDLKTQQGSKVHNTDQGVLRPNFNVPRCLLSKFFFGTQRPGELWHDYNGPNITLDS